VPLGRSSAALAVYAGTFDPVTRGHLSVIERASRLFCQVLVVVAVNPTKTPLFSAAERVEMIRQVARPLRNVTCASTEGLVVALARARGARYLVRGVRSCTDADAELALAAMNHRLAPEIETIFVPAQPELSEVSSSELKRLAAAGADISRFCSPEIAARLRQRLGAAGRSSEAHG
jgi:pantetheine-phosphate adenylyltransferase